jgi:glutamyl-tRNA synthetase
MAHLPLIMSPNGGKLSKRKAEEEGIPVNTKEYIKQNYEPEALVNFLAYLGWSPGDDSEIHSLEKLSELFTLERVSKGGAVFNHKKLLWYNENYLREQSNDELAERLRDIAEEKNLDLPDNAFLKQAISLLKERVSKIEEILEMGDFFFKDPESYDEKALKKWKDDSGDLVSQYKSSIEKLDDDEFEATALKSHLEDVINKNDVGFGKLMMPLRIAVTGQGFGPDLFSSMELLGKKTVISRLGTALDKLD